jgi:hypothetical protein
MEFESEEQFQEVLLDLRELTLDLKVYGIYKKGITA